MDKNNNDDLDDMSEQNEYIKKHLGFDMTENNNFISDHDNEEKFDQSKSETYLPFLKEYEDFESKQGNVQPRLMKSFDSDSYDSDSSNTISDEFYMLNDQDEYAEYMRKLYGIGVDKNDMNGNSNKSGNEIKPTEHFSRNIYPNSEADNTNPIMSEQFEIQGEFDQSLYPHFDRSLRNSQEDDKLDGPVVSQQLENQPRLASSYDDIYDNTVDMGRDSDNMEADYAELLKRLQSMNNEA